MTAQRNSRSGGSGPSLVDEFRLSDSPSHLLRRAQQYASDIFARAGLSDSVTLRQTVLLAAIAEKEGRSQSELVRATGVDRSTLADMMARMERKGLIARAAAARDGRAKSVKLTPAGRKRMADVLPAIREIDARILAALPRAKRRMFRETLGALSDAADAAEEADVAEAKAAKDAAKVRKTTAKLRRRMKKKKARKNRRKG